MLIHVALTQYAKKLLPWGLLIILMLSAFNSFTWNCELIL